MIILVLYLAVMVIAIAGVWAAFVKAGKPGWAAIVPIYNLIVMCEIAGKPVWWAIVIIFVPIVGLIFAILLMIEIAKAFGQGAGFGVGLALLGFIFWPMLGFGSAQYQGPSNPY